ncbi:MAG: riboflavin synthase [Bacteroidia bacterium]|jgi:riboflavin synthase
MFTGIIEDLGKVTHVQHEGTNVHFTIASTISNELKIDQSVAHNGVCLTVTACDTNTHTVTAIQETLDKSNLADWQVGTHVNLERCLKMGDRLDGHMVQGHVDTTAICTDKKDQEGSWMFTFKYQPAVGQITVEKGSITINGTSLTVFNSGADSFSVAIIPYTYEHTNFKDIEIGSTVNIEFDILGKYILKMLPKG